MNPGATPGNRIDTSFFTNSITNRLGAVPGSLALIGFANNQNGGQGNANSYNSRVLSSQTNGAGPSITPIHAPFSFLSFTTGIRTLALKRIGRK